MRKSLFIVYGLFFISLSILGSLSFIFYERYSVYTRYANAVEDTYQVIAELNRLSNYLKDAETGQRGFLLTTDSAFLKPYLDGINNIKSTFLKVQEMTSDNESQQERLGKLNILIQDKLNSMEHTRYMFLFNRKEYMVNFKASKEKMDECRKVIEDMEQVELQLLGMRQESKEIYESSAPEYLTALFSFSAFAFLGSFVLIVREFRSRVKYQRELEQNVRELNQSNTELEQIAYVSSHDLQEPLRKINTFSDRLESKHSNKLNEEGKYIISRIRSASDRIRELIEDLGNYTSLIKRNGERSQVDLNSVIAAVIQQHRDVIKVKGVNITYEHLPPVLGNSDQLHLMFDALIDNSIKFCRQDVTPSITITSAQSSSDELGQPKPKNVVNRYIKITIKDNGIGFDNEFSQKMFAIFQRLHNQDSEYTGKGVGLAIVKRVMANHNGYVFATGKVMEGAEFALLFPVE